MLACVKAWQAGLARQGFAAHPALLDYRDERGRNWLHIASGVAAGRRSGASPADAVPLVDALLDLGLDIDGAAFQEGEWQATPLWYAVARGRNVELARFLLDRGATPEHCLWAAAFAEDLAMLELLVDAGAPIEAVAEEETPLLGAVKCSKFTSAEWLLGAGADPDFRDVHGMTALHYMLKKNSDLAHFEMFARHAARGDIEGPDGRTAAAIMRRKRDPAFHRLADRLRSA